MAGFQSMKHLWLAFVDYAAIAFRALGLNIVVCWFRSFLSNKIKRKHRIERLKVVIRKHRPAAFLRALVHVLPVAAALFLVIINLYQYYVGSSIQSLVFYQSIAKVFEIMAQASLAAIVFSYIRHETVLGQGVPLGALFSGLQLTQASYLWSTEFWSTITSDHLPLGRRSGLIAIIVSSIYLAAVVGPSSAVLLIPRLDYWPAGSTNIWINITSDDLWPMHTNRVIVPQDCSTVNRSANIWSCPSDEWHSIEDYLRSVRNSLPRRWSEQFGLPAHDEFQVTANAAVRQLLIKRQFWQPYVNSDIYTVVVTSEQAAVADALTATGTLWGFGIDNVTTGGHGVPYETLNAVHRIRENYFQPYTMGSCASDTIEGPNDERPLAFPIPPGVLPQDLPAQEINNSLLQYPAITLPNVTRTEILKISGPAWENRLHWIELPQGLYNGSAIGAIVLLPMQDAKPGESASEQNILLCTLGAGWGQSTLNVTTQLFGYSNVQSAMSNPESVMREFLSAQAGEGSPSTVGISSAENLADMVSGVFLLPSYPQIQMNISTTWARYLNPFITELNTTVFHHLMQGNFTSHSPGVSAGIILPSLLANGLARIGIESSLQGELRTTTDSSGENVTDWNSWFQGKGDAFIVDSQESKDWLKLKVDTTFEGYAYNSSGVGPKVSITSLLLYCAFAIAHTCYAGISGISSNAWDSIGELICLAMNSAPTKLLRNTSSGVTETNIFKLPARIFAKPDDEGEGEHLELVLGEQDEKTLEQRTLKMNRVYG